MSDDPITEIVRSIDLIGAVFLQAEFTAPWAITAQVTREDCGSHMPIPRQVIAYHIVIEGDFFVSLNKRSGLESKQHVKTGDVLLFPQNREHVLASDPGTHPVCSDDLILPAMVNGMSKIEHGGGGRRTRILCGFMAGNAGTTPLIDILPEMLIVHVDSLETRNWIEASAVMAAKQLVDGDLHGSRMITELCQLLLAEALRLSLTKPDQHTGWLNGMAYPRIARVLARMHRSLDKPNSVSELATEAGMSRSAFVARFTEVMGIGPQRYMLDERMKRAAALLRDGNLTSAEIALRVGYDAPEAFSRAFKKKYGQAPRNWRARATKDHMQSQIA